MGWRVATTMQFNPRIPCADDDSMPFGITRHIKVTITLQDEGTIAFGIAGDLDIALVEISVENLKIIRRSQKLGWNSSLQAIGAGNINGNSAEVIGISIQVLG